MCYLISLILWVVILILNLFYGNIPAAFNSGACIFYCLTRCNNIVDCRDCGKTGSHRI